MSERAVAERSGSGRLAITREEFRRLPREHKEAWLTAMRRDLLPARSGGSVECARYQQDPVAYAHDVLGLTLTPDQEEMALSVRDHRRTAVKASHAIGKTVLAAAMANWWWDCWEEHIVYITAPSWPQCLGLTFKAVKHQRMGRALPGEILDSGMVRDANRLRAGRHYIRALNAQKQEGFQGEHAAPILIILEEAVGVPPYIWRAVDGLLTEESARVLAIFNPTDEATPAGEMCRSPFVNVLTASGLDHPNILAQLEGEEPPYPGAVELRWVFEMLSRECEVVDTLSEGAFEWWGLSDIETLLTRSRNTLDPGAGRAFYRPNAVFQGQVLGVFPTQADEQVIPRGWLEALPAQEPGDAKPEIGCDVARFGADRSVIVTRRGPVVLAVRALRQMDNLFVTQALREAAQRAARECGGDPKDVPIRIDVTGGLGTGPYDLLRAEKYRVVPVNASNRARDTEQYHNQRSELWFTMRERVREHRLDLSRLDRRLREDLIRELCTPKYKPDSSGRKVVEAKESIKSRLGFSPDLADALNLAFAESGAWWQDKELNQYLLSRGPEAKSEPRKQAIEGNLAAWMKGS